MTQVISHGFYFALGVILAIAAVAAVMTLVAYLFLGLGLATEFTIEHVGLPLLCLIRGHDLRPPNRHRKTSLCSRCGKEYEPEMQEQANLETNEQTKAYTTIPLYIIQQRR